jgi:ABC-type dipeptide/oligopeptide/nickel transport system permease subunit
MKNDFIDMLEPTPLLKSKKCKIISFILRIFLQFFTYFITFVVWYIYDYFIAFFALMLSFIVIGIIRSKLRNSVIPIKQREYQYSDKGIADWYTAKELCVEVEDEKDL